MADVPAPRRMLPAVTDATPVPPRATLKMPALTADASMLIVTLLAAVKRPWASTVNDATADADP